MALFRVEKGASGNGLMLMTGGLGSILALKENVPITCTTNLAAL